MPYLVWGGISLAIGIISYLIPADNLNVATDGLYSSIIGVFQNFTNEFKDKYNNIAKTIAPAMVSIGTILVFAYSVKKYKNNEFFEIKTFTQFAFFLALLSLMHFALNSPKKFHSYVEFFVEAPAVILNNAIEETTKTFYKKAQQQSNQSQNKTNQSFISFNGNIQGIIKNQTKQLFAFYESFRENNAGFSKPFVFIMQSLSFVAIVFFQILLIFKTIYLICIIFIEKTFYLLCFIFMTPCLFFKQTQGFFFSYIKKVFSLTFYAPLVFLFAMLNSIGLELFNPTQNIIETIGIIIISAITSALISNIPNIINTIFGTQGGSVDLVNFLKAGSQSFLSFASNIGSAVSGGVKGASVGTGNFLVKTEGAIGNAVNNIKNRASQPENIRTSVGFVNVGSKATR
ncbi:trbL/VirB6 plasmid conjugal transfer family protein [Helicobacter pylori]|uniref:TrbL/VirB6 plasmid conjugal transfer family protein n=1 Tax=Helicobacter pylori UM114 TaxID=1355531 RepID=T0ETH6_HELPX|nr:trbL/VirB6 plasmid conjugal transfer family protein [Helicobacter pylori]EPZ92734.1 trbL/VirB6 plasmid conjugal transfer family protein [Helicobacter pylori UM114]